MGQSATVGEFSAKVANAGQAIGRAQTNAVLQASLGVKSAMTGAIESMTGGDGRLSGRNNARISAAFDMHPGRYEAWSRMKARGPIMLVEADVPAHTIRPRRGKRGSGRRALKFGGGFAAYANHPGTTGKKRWARARDTVAPKIARRELRTANAKALAKAFQ